MRVTRPRRRAIAWRVASALVFVLLLGGTVVMSAGGAATASPTPAGTIPPSTGDPISLLSQSTYVESGNSFQLRVAVASGEPSTDRLVVTVYRRLTDRTHFDAALSGSVPATRVYLSGAIPLSSLTADPAGGVKVAIPVNEASTSPYLRDFAAATSQSGIYPLQVKLIDANDVAQGRPLTTFMVFVDGDRVPKLSVAWVLPVHAAPALSPGGQATRLPDGESQSLATLVAALAGGSRVPLTLAVTPQTVEALATGSTTDKATLSTLVGLTATGRDQVLLEPYVSLDVPATEAAGLDSELTTELTAGSAADTAALHQSPSAATWVFDGPLDSATLAALPAHGAKNIIVPDAQLTDPPTAYRQNTFARPAGLVARNGARLNVFGADTGLAAHFVNGGDQVLAAYQLLAELAMIQVETPSDVRGVALVPPAGWNENPTFISTVLSGLADSPLLDPVDADGLFATVPMPASGAGSVDRSLIAARPATGALADAGAIRTARQHLAGFAEVVTSDGPLVSQLSAQLLLGQSSDLGNARRGALFSSVSRVIKQQLAQISLPTATSITLTARQGGVPLTITSDPALDARVELRLSSEKLRFEPFNPPGGQCSTPRATSVVCQLQLSNRATTLRIPVEARTSGVFSLAVELTSPDGQLSLASGRDTVRSTAVSGVGLVLMIGAALFLGLWWIKNLRHGRRARQLVRRPESDELAPGADDDPVIADFFSSPPPAFRRPAIDVRRRSAITAHPPMRRDAPTGVPGRDSTHEDANAHQGQRP